MTANLLTNIRALTDRLSICHQIAPTDVATIATLGFKSIVCNRPDNETADQPKFFEIELAANAFGLKAHYLPAESVMAISADQAKQFDKLIRELPAPTLAYCRTGLRSARFWELVANTTSPT
jgi:sulfide:quinone oxidoreductase